MKVLATLAALALWIASAIPALAGIADSPLPVSHLALALPFVPPWQHTPVVPS